MLPLRNFLVLLARPFSANIRPTIIRSQLSTNVGIVDAAMDKGQRKEGVAEGPNSLREAGLIRKLRDECAVDVRDYGAVSCPKTSERIANAPRNMINYEQVVDYNRNLSGIVERVIRDNRICLTLGGDHSIGLGSVSGHCRAKGPDNVALVWVDAHADLNTSETSPSGNMHGMPVALLAAELTPYWTELPMMRDWHDARLPSRSIAYIGLRSIDPYEEWLIEKLGITCYDIAEVQRSGIGAVIAAALRRIDPDGAKSVHLSFDIDALDPSHAPSTGTPVDGGLLLREGIYIASSIHNTGRLGAMDLVEVNPTIGTRSDVQRTVSSAIQIIMSAFGYGRRGVRPDLPDLMPRGYVQK